MVIIARVSSTACANRTCYYVCAMENALIIRGCAMDFPTVMTRRTRSIAFVPLMSSNAASVYAV